MSLSSQMTTAALCWLRFRKRMLHVATEVAVGDYSMADCLGCDDTQSIEIEIKITATDFQDDFKYKKLKHREYLGEKIEKYKTRLVPNRLYFLVPSELESLGIELLKEKPYGLMLFNGSIITCRKIAKPLHRRRPTNWIRSRIAARCSSELLNHRLDIL